MTNGRPIQTPQPPGAPTSPGQQGATNWYSPSYSPRTGLFYVSAWEDVGQACSPQPGNRVSARRQLHGRRLPGDAGARLTRPSPRTSARPTINTWTDAAGHGAVDRDRSGAPATRKWTFPMYDLTDSGHPHDRVGSAVHRRPRRLFPGARRAHGRAVVEEQPRLGADAERPDDLRGRRPAVRRDHRRQRAGGVRLERLTPTPTRLAGRQSAAHDAACTRRTSPWRAAPA